MEKNKICRLIASFLIGALIFIAPATNSLLAQTNAPEHQFEHEHENLTYAKSKPIKADKVFSGLVVKYPESANKLNEHELEDLVKLRFFVQKTQEWSEWVIIEPGYDSPEGTEQLVHPEALVLTAPATSYQVQILDENDEHDEHSYELSDFTFETLGGATVRPPSQRPVRLNAGNLVATADTSFLDAALIPRSAWGANEYLRYDFSDNNSTDDNPDKDTASGSDSRIRKIIDQEDGNDLLWPYEFRKETKGIVVHHTVTAAADDVDDFSPIVNAIYEYHTNTRGWGDIGYNILVAPNGQVFEGRAGGFDVAGAHARGYNYETFGIAMIGNFEIDVPSSTQLDALMRSIISVASNYDLDINDTYTANGTTEDVLSGHRDVGKTACPGKNMYALLPAVRKITSKILNTNSTVNSQLENLNTDIDFVNLKPGEKETIELKIKNISKTDWKNFHFVFPDYWQYENAITFLNSEREIIAKSSKLPIKAGASATVTVELQGEIANGFVPVLLTPVINGVYSDIDQILLPVSVEADFEYSLLNTPTFRFTNDSQAKSASITLKNDGNFTWDERVQLGVDEPRDQASKFASEPISSGRILQFDQEVDPGETVTLKVPINIPKISGSYSEAWRPVINGFNWASGPAVSFNFQNNSVPEQPQNSQNPQTPTGNGSLLNAQKQRITNAQRLSNPNKAVVPTSGVDSEPIRVHLSYVNLAQQTIKLNSSYSLFVDGQRQRLVNQLDSIKVVQQTDGVQIDVNGVKRSGKIVRLEPYYADLGVFEIVEYEQRPGWNPSLNDNTFRGVAEFRLDEGKLIVINELPMYQYLRGIAEVSNNSSGEMIKTLMILSRTYAAMHREVYNVVNAGQDTSALQFAKPKYPGKPYSANDNPDSFQKYRGYGFELRSPNVTKYLDEVINEVVTYEGKLVITPYFSCSNGQTISGKDKWGWDFAPYLQSVKDPGGADGLAAGHGVGLSGCGGRVLAEEEGYDYKKIIQYFYKGVKIEKR